MNKDSIDSTTLIFKNIPKQINDLTSLLNSLNIPAKEIKPFGRKRALITYELKDEAEHALNTLQDLEFSGKCANISLFCRDKPKENNQEKQKSYVKKSHKSVQTTIEADGTTQPPALTAQQVTKYVQKLYAIEGDLGFEQPPAAYLKYSYPPINKDILDNICIALLSNKRFYTQVLHLMNRMNLEPPFGSRNYKLTQPGVPREACTQTENIIIQDNIYLSDKSKEKRQESESELESSEDDVCKTSRPQSQIKRKLPLQEEQYKKKARQILQTAQKQCQRKAKRTTNTNLSVKDIFDTPQRVAATTSKIELQLKPSIMVKEAKEIHKPGLNFSLDLNAKKLPLTELETLPVYKNYQKGQASNKLYIKNLHKDVTSEDLILIYQRYFKDHKVNLNVKVMQHGRMKGQAFVTFEGNQMEVIEPIIAKALEDTNGFILRDKPMVVCYGKQT